MNRLLTNMSSSPKRSDDVHWNRAGVAFENKDGSFTFKLDVFPQTKFQLREEKPLVKEEAAAE